MAPHPNSFLCFFSRDRVREKQRKLLDGGAITDGETDAKSASVDGPLTGHPRENKVSAWVCWKDLKSAREMLLTPHGARKRKQGQHHLLQAKFPNIDFLVGLCSAIRSDRQKNPKRRLQ
jgi:hypothetical protein